MVGTFASALTTEGFSEKKIQRNGKARAGIIRKFSYTNSGGATGGVIDLGAGSELWDLQITDNTAAPTYSYSAPNLTIVTSANSTGFVSVEYPRGF